MMEGRFRPNLRVLTALSLGVATASCFAQQLLGAKEVLRRHEEVETKRNPLGSHLFEASSPQRPSTPLNPGEWASQSLKSSFDFRGGDPRIMGQLPPPKYWPAIDAAYRTGNAPLPFKILGSYLVGDSARLKSLVKQAAATNPNLDEVWDLVLELGECWSDQELVTMAFEHQVAQLKQAEDNGLPLYQGPISTISIRSYRTPGLVRIVGRQRAKEMYRGFFRTLKTPIEFMSRDDYEVILDLFRKEGSTFPFPHFEVIQTIDAADLYPAMAKRFTGEDEPNKSYAFTYFALFSILAGNGDAFLLQAKDVASTRFNSIFLETILRSFDIEESLGESYSDPKKAVNAFDFFAKALKADPSIQLWRELCEAGLAAGKRERLISILEEATQKYGRKPQNEFESNPPELLRSLARWTETSSQTADRLVAHLKEGYGESVDAIRMGHLLKRADLIEIGSQSLGRTFLPEGIDLLIQAQRFGEIESEYINGTSPDPSSLVHLYSSLGRNSDVVDMLNLCPQWRSKDLKDDGDWYNSTQNFHLEVAKALLATGDRQNGLNVLRWSLRTRTKVDEGYRTLIETLGDTASLAEVNRMEQQDRFDNRPPLWRATILLKHGQLEEAEKAARKSIVIDPADEDIEPGRRMVAYDLLADILEARKKPKEAAGFRKVVQAIRLSEEADQYVKAGLGSEAIRIYRQALQVDPDSCRSHLRLADALFNGGFNSEAESSYRRGFGLLPKYITRACSIPVVPEKHFWNRISMRVGEEVFGAMVKARPGNARALYLLGLVRLGQNRIDDSQELMRRAVAVDPEFLRAHQALAMNVNSVHGVPPEVEQGSLMAILSLSPTSRCNLSGTRTLDPAAMFLSLDRRREIDAQPLYPLPAVKSNGGGGGVEATNQTLFNASPLSEIASYIAASQKHR